MTAIFLQSSGTIRVLEIVPRAKGPYQHRFGGVPVHAGIVSSEKKPPLHLLYTFDLSDPRLAIVVRGASSLPLFFGFSYDSTRLSYTVDSDRMIKIVHQEKTEPVEDFPYPNYPSVFPEVSVDLQEQPLAPLLQREDPYDPFQEEILKRSITGKTREDILNALDPSDKIAFAAGLPQGPSRDKCLQPGCPGGLMIFCVIDYDAIPGLHLWDEWGEGEEVKIVYEMCPVCSLIRVTNQCT